MCKPKPQELQFKVSIGWERTSLNCLWNLRLHLKTSPSLTVWKSSFGNDFLNEECRSQGQFVLLPCVNAVADSVEYVPSWEFILLHWCLRRSAVILPKLQLAVGFLCFTVLSFFFVVGVGCYKRWRLKLSGSCWSWSWMLLNSSYF